MSGARLAILAILLVPAFALGQAREDDETNKVSNDKPDRPIQMPPASSEVKEALDDFERFQRRGAWERALKSLYSIPEDQARRFVDGSNGFIVPVARKRRDVLAGLPTDGQAAYRLLYDDEAKKLLEQADGPSERATLERINSAYFLTSVGDNAADRLGDLDFEMGRFDRAADCWLAILREHPDTDLSPALISIKAALALTRAGRSAEVAPLRRELADRYAGEKVAIGGQTATVEEHLSRLLGDQGTAKGPAIVERAKTVGLEKGPDLTRPVPAAWQFRFAESIVAGMAPPERLQWDSNPLSGAVPAVAIVGSSLYANFLGHDLALNLDNGKLIWRSGSFHNIEVPAAQNQTRMIDPARFAIVASPSHVWSVSRDIKDPNQMAPFHLICRRADRGDPVWKSTDLPDYAQLDLIGPPILAGGSLFVVARTLMNQRQAPAQEYVLAIRPVDGKVRWKTEIGTQRPDQPYYYYGMRDTSPLPRLLEQAGAVYLDTQIGVLARLDAESGDLDWGFGYQTEPIQSSGRFFFWGMMQDQETTASGTPIQAGSELFLKGAKSDRIIALDPGRLKVDWDRPIAKSARLVGLDEHALFLGGPELCALDRKSRTLLWATRLPGGSAEGRVLARPDGLWQLTPRGIFELDPRSGQVRRIFRGEDTGSDGGDLYLTGRYLVAVTNRAITAYPRAANPANGPEKGPATTKTRATDD